MNKRNRAIIVTLAALVAGAAWVHHGARDRVAATPAVAGSQGYRVYIDATTDAIVSRPNGTDPVVLSPEVQNALSTSTDGLQETTSPVAGGGEMIDLQGRFQNTMMATVDADGHLTAPCVSGLPGRDDASDTAAKEQQ